MFSVTYTTSTSPQPYCSTNALSGTWSSTDFTNYGTGGRADETTEHGRNASHYVERAQASTHESSTETHSSSRSRYEYSTGDLYSYYTSHSESVMMTSNSFSTADRGSTVISRTYILLSTDRITHSTTNNSTELTFVDGPTSATSIATYSTVPATSYSWFSETLTTLFVFYSTTSSRSWITAGPSTVRLGSTLTSASTSVDYGTYTTTSQWRYTTITESGTASVATTTTAWSTVDTTTIDYTKTVTFTVRTYQTYSGTDLTAPTVAVYFPETDERMFVPSTGTYGEVRILSDAMSEVDSWVEGRNYVSTECIEVTQGTQHSWTFTNTENATDTFTELDYVTTVEMTSTTQRTTDFGELTTVTTTKRYTSYSESTRSRATGVIQTSTSSSYDWLNNGVGGTISTLTTKQVSFPTNSTHIVFSSQGTVSTTSPEIGFSTVTYSTSRSVQSILTGTFTNIYADSTTFLLDAGLTTTRAEFLSDNYFTTETLPYNFGYASSLESCAVTPSTDMTSSFGLGLTAVPSGYEGYFSTSSVLRNQVLFLSSIPYWVSGFTASQSLDSVTFFSATTTGTGTDTANTTVSTSSVFSHLLTNQPTFIATKDFHIVPDLTAVEGLGTLYGKGLAQVTSYGSDGASSVFRTYHSAPYSVPDGGATVLDALDYARAGRYFKATPYLRNK